MPLSYCCTLDEGEMGPRRFSYGHVPFIAQFYSERLSRSSTDMWVMEIRIAQNYPLGLFSFISIMAGRFGFDHRSAFSHKCFKTSIIARSFHTISLVCPNCGWEVICDEGRAFPMTGSSDSGGLATIGEALLVIGES
jgi:hypothetical protein